ncbi:unnamed protein product [Leuciscus chuanchicus]
MDNASDYGSEDSMVRLLAGSLCLFCFAEWEETEPPGRGKGELTSGEPDEIEFSKQSLRIIPMFLKGAVTH